MHDFSFSLSPLNDVWAGHFSAMACPCEILVVTDNKEKARQVTDIAYREALRIEAKFSRYRDDNIIHAINNANGNTIEVDMETADMLDFADQCYQLSDDKFDITSGVLREIWKFDGSDRIPTSQQVDAVVSRIGWNKVKWERPFITLQPGMEIDLGGIGKEYAVDQTAKLIREHVNENFLVNFGGDIYANGPRRDNTPWVIGIDDPQHTGEKAIGEIRLMQGGLATSGDARRFLLRDGIRYGHILDPTTGWPVPNAPHSVTVIANTCLEAGMLSTFAMLQGSGARQFLEAQQVTFWCA
jgi:thiamine biosynthesis lipoprotein